MYLHGVGDPGNVGAVIRSADALAGGTVVLGPGCADPHSPKAVRASMGSVFAVGLLRGEVRGDTSPPPGPGRSRPARGRAAAAATLCLGSEREGLPAEVLAECEARWTIPLREAAPSR